MMFQSRPGFARVASLAVAGVGCLALAACSTSSSTASSTSSSTASTAASSPSPASTVDPLASLTAAQVAAKAITDTQAASSLTIVGTLDNSGATYTVNLGIKPGKGCAGTIGQNGKGTLTLIVIGKTVYMKPDNTFWKSSLGSQAAAVIKSINGRYLKGSTSDSTMSGLSGTCDLSQMFKGSTSGKITKGKVTTLNGVRVLPLNTPDGSTGYVTDTSKPELTEIAAPKSAKDGSGKITITVGGPVTLTAPPASQVIDAANFGM